MPSARTALVTGISGFIGSALGRRLSADGWHVIGLTRSAGASLKASLGRVELLEVSSPTPANLERTLAGYDIDTVFHLAAAGVRGGTAVAELLAGNVDLVANLLQALASRRPRRFLQIGSCFEYGPACRGKLIDEDAPAAPLSVYGPAKLASVHVARTLAGRLGIPLVVLRLFGVYGADEAPGRLIPSLVRELRAGRGLDLTPGRQVRDLMYIDDAVEALRRAADQASFPAGSLFNVCTGVATEVRQVGELVADLLGRPTTDLRWGVLSPRTDEAAWIVGDPRRFQDATGWRPSWPLRRGIEETVAQLLQRLEPALEPHCSNKAQAA